MASSQTCTNVSSNELPINQADKTRQESNESLTKRNRKPLSRFSPDFFAKPAYQVKCQPAVKETKQNKPTACESCFVPFKNAALLSKRECRRRFFDPVANKTLLLCNACGVRMARSVSRHPRKLVVKEIVSDDDKNKYNIEMTRFTEILKSAFDDTDCGRLACPSTSPKLCRCIQAYITAKSENCVQTIVSDSSGSTGWNTRALELLHLYKEARRLRDQKCLLPGNKSDNRNLKRRSAEYEQFVFSTRERLKKELKICERGAQTLLIYSNNFLHKQLKTSGMGPRIPRRPDLKSLVSVQNLVTVKCCRNRCTKLALSHGKLLQSWRSRAKLSQQDARNVLAEMLTPSAGQSTNCHLFIRLVTGCSSWLLCKVNQKIRSSQGEREPVEHGLRKYWHRRRVLAAVHKGPKIIKEDILNRTPVIKSENNEVSENKSCLLSVVNENQQLTSKNPSTESLQVTDVSNIQLNDVKQRTFVSSVFQSVNNDEPVSSITKTIEHSNSITENYASINSNTIQYVPVSVIQNNTSKNISNLISKSHSSSVENCISEPLYEPSSSLAEGISHLPLVLDNTTLHNVSIEGVENVAGELITLPVVLQEQLGSVFTSLQTSSESLNLQPTLIWTTSGLFLLSAAGTSTSNE